MSTPSRFVFTLEVPTGVARTTSTYYVTTRGFRTLSTDVPSSTYIQERVEKAGAFSRSLYSGGSLTGLIKPNFGVLTLNNEDGSLDDLATYAGGGGTVTCWWGEEGAAFPGGYTQVYKAIIASVLVDFNNVVIRQQDRFESLDRPIVTATFDGSGGIEGTDVSARKKQLVFGTPGMIPLTLVDKTNQIYYVQANASDLATVRGLTEFGLVFEGGVPIDRGDNYPFKAYLTLASQVPAPGEFRMWTGYDTTFASQAAADAYTKGPIYVRLGGVPVGDLRFGAVGMLQNTTGAIPREWRFSDLCNRAGINDVSHTAMVEMQNGREDFTAGNRLTEGDQTYAQVMADRCQSVLGAAGFNRLDQFFCVSLLGPEDGTDSSVYTFTEENSAEFRRLPVPGMERPVWQVNVKSGRAFPCTVFSGASAEMQDLLTREGHYIRFRGYSTEVRRRYPNAMSIDLTIDGHDFPTVSQQRNFVERFGELFGTRRDLIQLQCKQFDATTLAMDLHDKVTLTISRLDYDAGVAMRVVGIETDLDSRTVKFTLWGNDTGFERWVTTGGAFPADAGEPGGSWGGEDPPPDVVEQTTALLALNDQMGAFTGLIVGGPIAIPVPADAQSNSAAMGDFTGAIGGDAVTPDGAVLLLHFESSFTDSSSSANSGTAGGGAATSTTRAKWGSRSFIGDAAGYVTFPDAAHFDWNSRRWSVDFQLYIPTATVLATDNTIVCKWGATSLSWYVGINNSGYLRFFLSTDGTTGTYYTASPAPLARDTWMHIAVWRAASAGFICSIDGVRTGIATAATLADTSIAVSVFGTAVGGALAPVGLTIDELRLCVDSVDYDNSDFTPPTGAY